MGGKERSCQGPWAGWTMSGRIVFLITFLIPTSLFSE